MVIAVGFAALAGTMSGRAPAESATANGAQPAAVKDAEPAAVKDAEPAAAKMEPAAMDPDRLRGLLYRIDGEARVARLHPEAARDHARAAARFANQLAGRIAADGDPALVVAGGRLERAADALAEAAHRAEDEDIRAAAIAVEIEVRRLDEVVPAPEVR
jgi:hypothetical protein